MLFIADAKDFPSDEEHEKSLIKTNLIYRVNCTADPPELVLRDDMSGRVLSASLMDDAQVWCICHSVGVGGRCCFCVLGKDTRDLFGNLTKCWGGGGSV